MGHEYFKDLNVDRFAVILQNGFTSWSSTSRERWRLFHYALFNTEHLIFNYIIDNLMGQYDLKFYLLNY